MLMMTTMMRSQQNTQEHPYPGKRWSSTTQLYVNFLADETLDWAWPSSWKKSRFQRDLSTARGRLLNWWSWTGTDLITWWSCWHEHRTQTSWINKYCLTDVLLSWSQIPTQDKEDLLLPLGNYCKFIMLLLISVIWSALLGGIYVLCINRVWNGI